MTRGKGIKNWWYAGDILFEWPLSQGHTHVSISKTLYSQGDHHYNKIQGIILEVQRQLHVVVEGSKERKGIKYISKCEY